MSLKTRNNSKHQLQTRVLKILAPYRSFYRDIIECSSWIFPITFKILNQVDSRTFKKVLAVEWIQALNVLDWELWDSSRNAGGVEVRKRIWDIGMYMYMYMYASFSILSPVFNLWPGVLFIFQFYIAYKSLHSHLGQVSSAKTTKPQPLQVQ